VSQTLKKLEVLVSFYLGPALLPPLVMFPWVLRDRRTRFLVLVLAAPALSLALEVWTFQHYAAPATGLIYALVLQCMRHLRLWRFRGSPAGLFLVRATPLVCALTLAGTFVGVLLFPLPAPAMPRHLFLGYLERQQGRHLVIVRYQPNHDPTQEWVYNRADIDGAKVVWAREMDAESKGKLLRYFKDRRVWLMEPDANPAKLSPYP